MVRQQENFIHHLYILPEFQGQGIGKYLLDSCVEKYGVPLNLKCLRENKKACEFYKKNGWTEVSMAKGPDGIYINYRLENSA